MADGEAADGRLGHQLVDRMDWLTDQRHGALALGNARRNGAWLEHGHSLAALRHESLGACDAALVIAAGPSIKRNDPAVTIRDRGFAGAVVATGWYFSLVAGESLANRQVISPFVAMWMANALLLAVVLLLVWRPGRSDPTAGEGSPAFEG